MWFARTLIICFFLGVVPIGAEAADLTPRSILILEPSGPAGPFYPSVLSHFQAKLAESSQPVSILVEKLDFNRFKENGYHVALRTFLQLKYRDENIGVIVALSEGLLNYALSLRETLWPNSVVVFSIVDGSFSKRLRLPPKTTGFVTDANLQSMVHVASLVVPDLKIIALVGDNPKSDTTFGDVRDDISTVASNIEIIDLTNLAMHELLTRVAALPDNSAIIYKSLYSDGEGTYYSPTHALSVFSKAANRPIIVAADSFVGVGGFGGVVMVSSAIGVELAGLVSRIIEGEDVLAIPVSKSGALKPIFDWRELQRWGVSERSLPVGSEFKFRPLDLWETHVWQISATSTFALAIVVLLTWLLYEHWHRQLAEQESSQQLSEIAHMNRYATAGEMSSAIAHELNQPLGAILNNAETAELLLQSPRLNITELKGILSDIRRDDNRASEIIRRLRTLVSKKTDRLEDFDFNEVVHEAASFMAISASRNRIKIHADLEPQALYVNGDRIQLQQIVLNLIMNAIEAIQAQASGPRDIVFRTGLVSGDRLEFSISDSGPGVPTEILDRVFEPFFSSKDNGMGMGLSLVRRIVENHGGEVSAENGISCGAIFRFSIPLVKVRRR